ncbi:MAG: hypothetical protein QOI66_1636 [Myxococcales bacterium]|nr:hypothetical protein [Myxococcales bacterium]
MRYEAISRRQRSHMEFPGSINDIESGQPRNATAMSRTIPEPVIIAPEMQRLYHRAAQVAPARIPVLIVGETGVGKEHLAELIHTKSNRAHHPFIRINCAAITASLCETELFGHERGAFTGAERTKTGWLEAAGSGTVFLDEIGEMPVALQAKLLRALEANAAPRVGGTELRPIEARFVAASNRDLELEIEKGTFRRDLYHRIAGVQLRVPSLRQRTSEILPLAEAFARAAVRDQGRPTPQFSPAACQALLQHGWPGNIRELRNTIEAAVLFSSDGVIDVDELQLTSRLPTYLVDSTPPPVTIARDQGPVWGPARPSRDAIVWALAHCGGNQTLAAAQLGVGRRTLCRWLIRLSIPRPRKGNA